MKYVLQANHLIRRFGKENRVITAVNDVSIDIGENEFVMLMGPSGSGKTTLLAMLGCLLKPSSGQILVMGKDISALSSRTLAGLRSKSIAFVFQNFNLLSSLKAWENVALAGDFFNNPADKPRNRAVEILEETGLGHRIESLPQELSAGEKQRVAFARALFNRPGIILADEPTANLDMENREIVLKLLRSAVDEKKTSVIIATHDERTQSYADRILRIEDGKLLQDTAGKDSDKLNG